MEGTGRQEERERGRERRGDEYYIEQSDASNAGLEVTDGNKGERNEPVFFFIMVEM